MFKQGILAVIIIGFLACSLMVLATSSTSMAKNEKPLAQESKQSQAGGSGGCTNCNDVNGNTSEQKDRKSNSVQTARRSTGAARHVMAAPEKFPKDGVYIWCDPDGLWTMFWRSKEKFSVNATMVSEKPVIVKNAVKAKTLESQPNKIQVSSASNSRVGIVQLTSTDDSMQFNILINGQSNPSRVYIGSRLSNPKEFPLKLATRRLFAQESTSETKKKTDQKSKESVFTVYPNNILFRTTPPSGGKGGGRLKKETEN